MEWTGSLTSYLVAFKFMPDTSWLFWSAPQTKENAKNAHQKICKPLIGILKCAHCQKKIPHNFNNNELQKTNLQSLGQSLDELQLVLNYLTEYFWKIQTKCSWETRHILWFSHDCREIPWTTYLTKSLSENITIALNCWLIAPIKQLRRGGNPVLVHNGANFLCQFSFQ